MFNYTLHTQISLSLLADLFEPLLTNKPKESVLSQDQIEYMIKNCNVEYIEFTQDNAYSFLSHFLKVIRRDNCLPFIETCLFCEYANQLGLLDLLYSKRLREMSFKTTRDITEYVILPYLDNSLSLRIRFSLENGGSSTKTFSSVLLYNTLEYEGNSIPFSEFIAMIQEKKDEFHSLLTKSELMTPIEIKMDEYKYEY